MWIKIWHFLQGKRKKCPCMYNNGNYFAFIQYYTIFSLSKKYTISKHSLQWIFNVIETSLQSAKQRLTYRINNPVSNKHHYCLAIPPIVASIFTTTGCWRYVGHCKCPTLAKEWTERYLLSNSLVRDARLVNTKE